MRKSAVLLHILQLGRRRRGAGMALEQRGKDAGATLEWRWNGAGMSLERHLDAAFREGRGEEGEQRGVIQIHLMYTSLQYTLL